MSSYKNTASAPSDVKQLLQELQTHQIELELQNEQLREAQLELSDALDRYADLFDFAPVGYLILERGGEIREANLAAAELLGEPREAIIGQPLARWVAAEHQDALHLYCRALLHSDGRGGCELKLARPHGEVLWVAVQGSSVIRTGQRGGALRLALNDVSERVAARLVLDRYQARLQELATQQARTQESEKQRIAAGLHDSVGQLLAASLLKLSELSPLLQEGPARQRATELSELLRQTVAEVRELSFELGPPVLFELGLAAAIEWLLERYRQRYPFTCDFVDRCAALQLEGETARVAFGVVQELLFNVAKHATARRVEVSLERADGFVRICVADDGVGYDEAELAARQDQHAGLGHFKVAERVASVGGMFEASSAPGQGVRATVTFPIRPE